MIVTIVPRPHSIHTFQPLPSPKHDSLSRPEISTALEQIDIWEGGEQAELEGDVRVIEAFQIVALSAWEFTASSVTTVANP